MLSFSTSSCAKSFEQKLKTVVTSAMKIRLEPIDDYVSQLFPEERNLIKDSVSKRRHEFATGRILLREALAHHSLDRRPILRDSAGAPVGPRNHAISISHSYPFCVAAAAPKDQLTAIGIDIEQIQKGRCSWSLDLVFSFDERKHLEVLNNFGYESPEILMFSAKETVFKLVYYWLGARLGPHDISVWHAASRHGFHCKVRLQGVWLHLPISTALVTYRRYVVTVAWTTMGASEFLLWLDKEVRSLDQE